MYKKIYKKIKEYDNIVIARHTGVDPDAYGSQIALKEIIKATFPNKNVYAVGIGSSKFKFIGNLDKVDKIDNSLLIILDTPIKRRIDIDENLKFDYSIKIDHHPFEEKICDLELIDDNLSSVCEMIYVLTMKTKMKMTKYAAERLIIGIVADTNRFLFEKSKNETMKIVNEMVNKYNIDMPSLYENLYIRSMKEVVLQGYMSNNMIITKNKVGYIVITDDILKEHKVDAATPGNLISQFTYIEELLVWITFTEDIKQNQIRVSIRSRGPKINEVAQQYNGGGHEYASGIKLGDFEKIDEIVKQYDKLTKAYIKEYEKK